MEFHALVQAKKSLAFFSQTVVDYPKLTLSPKEVCRLPSKHQREWV